MSINLGFNKNFNYGQFYNAHMCTSYRMGTYEKGKIRVHTLKLLFFSS